MARNSASPQAGRGPENRNRLYTILALFVIAVMIVFVYGPFGRDKEEPAGTGPGRDTDTSTEVNADAGVISEADVAVSEMNEMILPEPRAEVTDKPNLPAIAPGPVVEPNPDAAELIVKATALIGEKPPKIIEARDKLNEALRMPMSVQQRAFVKDRLSELAEKWLFSRTVFPDDELCESYNVQRGDILAIIGDRHKVPYEILAEINRIRRPETLPAGETIKVINGPFHAKVYRSTFTMDVYLQTTYVRSYPVGLGMPGKETPTGLWRVRPGGKAYATSWQDPDTGIVYQPEDPDYPLGSRWIALEGLTGEAKGREGFGIHGTKDPEQIGTAGSRGCIRMFNGEVIRVYNMLVPGLSQVEVAD